MRAGTQLVNGGLRVRSQGGNFFFQMRDSFPFSLKPSLFETYGRGRNSYAIFFCFVLICRLKPKVAYFTLEKKRNFTHTNTQTHTHTHTHGALLHIYRHLAQSDNNTFLRRIQDDITVKIVDFTVRQSCVQKRALPHYPQVALNFPIFTMGLMLAHNVVMQLGLTGVVEGPYPLLMSSSLPGDAASLTVSFVKYFAPHPCLVLFLFLKVVVKIQ